MPSLSQVADKVRQIHGEVRQLAEACGATAAKHEEMVRVNTELTDQALEEITLQLAFLMSIIRTTKPLHGGIAGPDGKVPTETKTASQLYMEGGRARLLAQRKASQDAQGLPTAENPATGNGAATDADSADATADLSKTGPITH